MAEATGTVSQGKALLPKAGHKAIRVSADGESAWIAAFRCPECGALAGEKTMACRRCGSREALTELHVGPGGSVYSWCVIHRSYPGVFVPFISAVVDLDGGLTLKGTLRGIDVADLKVGTRVQVAFDNAGGAVDKDGACYVGFHFRADGAA